MKCSSCNNKKNSHSKKNEICKKCISKEMHKYYLRNREKIKERAKIWKFKNKDWVVRDSKKYRDKLKIDALKAYSNNDIKCACCGEREIDFLCLDHINDNGAKERKNNKYGSAGIFKWLKKNNYPKNVGLQVLCFNCNISKRINKGTCIHKLK